MQQDPRTIHIPSANSGDAEDLVSVSTAFFPDANFSPSDVVLCSTDNVQFYIHASVILEASTNHFGNLIDPGTAPFQEPVNDYPTIRVDESSEVLNIILHAIYRVDSSRFGPSIQQIQRALESFRKYGFEPRELIVPGSSLHQILTLCVPTNALDVYAIAGQFAIESLAAHASSHLLGLPLHTVNDDFAMRMGWKYLRRLFELHSVRLQALKTIILSPVPQPHEPNRTCSSEDQNEMVKQWTAIQAALAWEVTPDMTVPHISSMFSGVINAVTCARCREVLNDQLNDMTAEWAAVRTTICHDTHTTFSHHLRRRWVVAVSLDWFLFDCIIRAGNSVPS